MASSDLEAVWGMARTMMERGRDEGDAEREALGKGALLGISVTLKSLGIPHSHWTMDEDAADDWQFDDLYLFWGDAEDREPVGEG